MGRQRLIAILVVGLCLAGCSNPAHGTHRALTSTSPTTVASEPTSTSVGTTSSTTGPVTTSLPQGFPAITKTSDCVLSFDPDPSCTPGAVEPRAHVGPIRSAVDPSDPYDICASGYTKTIRPPVSVTDHLKAVVARRYGITDSLSNYEGDHLIPLEVGGAPEGDPAHPEDVSNFFDEPHVISGPDGQPAGSPQKDKFENYLHRVVCAGQVALATAQHEIAVNWYENWAAAGRPTG